MGFMDSLSISASGMTAERLRMDVIANNLANVNTTRTPGGGPFRREQVVLSPAGGSFGDALAAATGDSESGLKGVQVTAIVPDTSPFKRVYEPGHPDADAQGYVSMPNIDTVTEMVDMMGATRAYEANVAAVDAIKSMAEKAIEIGRS
ncbi:MAG: flagellar basal body rod protein FlgC [Armatimonadetes bacterium]|nr:flagellar basal body rod protein FlgC [Armatimonadota bacterium]